MVSVDAKTKFVGLSTCNPLEMMGAVLLSPLDSVLTPVEAEHCHHGCRNVF